MSLESVSDTELVLELEKRGYSVSKIPSANGVALHNRTLYSQYGIIKLSKILAKIVELLLLRYPQIVSNADLALRVWDGDVNLKTVYSHMHRLHTLLGPDAIIVRRYEGYRIIPQFIEGWRPPS